MLGGRAERADSFVTRFCGLMLRTKLEPGSGLILSPCTSIHMFFMRIALDVVFLDQSSKVIALYPELKPWRISGIHWKAQTVVELPVGTIADSKTEVGDELQIQDITDAP